MFLHCPNATTAQREPGFIPSSWARRFSASGAPGLVHLVDDVLLEPKRADSHSVYGPLIHEVRILPGSS